MFLKYTLSIRHMKERNPNSLLVKHVSASVPNRSATNKILYAENIISGRYSFLSQKIMVDNHNQLI